MTDRFGLIAGWGRLPVEVAKRLHDQGVSVICAGFRDLADAANLRPFCAEYREFGVAKLGHQARYLQRRGVRRATMAGKVNETIMFQRFSWLRHLPDFAFTRHFYHQFMTSASDRKDDTMLLTAIRLFQSYGVDCMPATEIAPELLVKEGTLTRSRPGRRQMADIAFGWQLARQMGGLDVGQSVVVKGRAALAVEAIEGTDECIRRAGQLCPSGGFTVVKVAKPEQDMRFDVPTVGVGTLETMKRAGGRVLAIEAGRTIILDQPAMVQFADRHRIAVVAVQNDRIEQWKAA